MRNALMNSDGDVVDDKEIKDIEQTVPYNLITAVVQEEVDSSQGE
jgi:hypothetical protein